MSDTPITDAAVTLQGEIMAEFARELERENAALRQELNCQKVCASDLAEKVRELRQESAMYEKMWKEANRLFITWCPESVKARKEAQP